MYPPAGGGMRDPVDIEPAFNPNKYFGSLSAGFLPACWRIEMTAFSTVLISISFKVRN
jgi:hypothetical protein